MIVIIENDAEVPPGTLVPALDASGLAYQMVKPYLGEPLPDSGRLAGAIVLGGIMSVNDTAEFPFLVNLKSWLAKALRLELPFLGICLGGQLLAEVSGGQVLFRAHEEFGCNHVSLTDAGKADPLFESISSPFPTFHWHNDCFIPPTDAVRLAWTEQCAHQAFRFGACAYGVQFHPEVNLGIVSGWSDLASHHHRHILNFQANESLLQASSRLLFRNFFDVVRRHAHFA